MRSRYRTLESAWAQTTEFFDKSAIIKEGELLKEHGDHAGGVYRYKNDIWKTFDEKKLYENEKKCYEDIKDRDIIPEVETDDENMIIRMSDVGESIQKHNTPSDFTSQCKRINRSLADADIYHNDMHNGNIRVNKDGKVRVIDFDLATRSDPLDNGANDCCNFWYKHPHHETTENKLGDTPTRSD